MKNHFYINMSLKFIVVFVLSLIDLSLFSQVNFNISESTITPLNIQVVDESYEENGKLITDQMIRSTEWHGDNILLYFNGKIVNSLNSKLGFDLSKISMCFKCCGKYYDLPLKTCISLNSTSNVLSDSLLYVNPRDTINIFFSNFISLNECPMLSPLTVKKIIRSINSNFYIRYTYTNFERKQTYNEKIKIKNIKPFFLSNCVSASSDLSVCSIIYEVECAKKVNLINR